MTSYGLDDSSERSPSRKRYLQPSVFWSIRQGIPVWLKLLMPTIGLGLPLLAWAIVGYGGWVPSLFLPTPTAVLQVGVKMLTEESLLTDIFASSGRVLAGFLLAAIVGIPIGIVMGTFHSLEGLFAPLVGTVRYMPVAAFMPLIIIWVGLGEPAKIVIIFMGIVLYNAIMVADGVKFIPDDMLNVAYTLGASRRDILLKVVLPAAFPSILDALRVNIAGAWNFLVLSELIAANSGLGFKILQSQRYVQTDKVLFCIIVIGAIGWLTDFALQRLSKALTPWADQARS
jgi:NitT/TauT family transport system permease protein